MTKLIVNLYDVFGELEPGDLDDNPNNRVVVWAPAHRTGPNGGVVHTRKRHIKLVNGKGEREVVPGPLVVQIQCGGVVDTRERRVVVPDDVESITLADLFRQTFTYTPVVVSQVSEDAAAAKRARDEAEAARDTVVAAEEVVVAAEGLVVPAAEQVAQDRAHVDQVKGHVDDASAAAVTAAGIVHAVVDQAVSDATDTALDAAASAIAAAVSVAQFQGHGFPEGKVAAPVGSIYTDLDATAGAVRWIKTSGTGTIGWKVQYGDTGERDVSGMLEPGFTAVAATLRRVGDLVELVLEDLAMPSDSAFLELPSGFIPPRARRWVLPRGSAGSVNVCTVQVYTVVRAYAGAGGTLRQVIQWTTRSPWPSSLPGTRPNHKDFT